MLKLYNTLTKEMVPFKPLKDKNVSMYSCGPTVYDYAHLGNLAAFIFVDTLKRYFIYSGYDVFHVMNITDVDDKTIAGSQREKRSLVEYTEFYTETLLNDLNALNIILPDKTPRATKHINEMIEMIKTLLDKGYAYEAEGSIYFRIKKSKDYGKIAGIDFENLKHNALGRNIKDEYDKEELNDFVLWKGYQPEDGDVFWETDLGKGRPGWHIECSAMSMAYLGNTFDIHTGGIDLIFPHHTNEIAQSEACTGKKFVNHWLHNAHILVDGKKMSKSLNNFYTLKDITEKGYDPLLVRYSIARTHYRQTANFTMKTLDDSRTAITKIIDFMADLDMVENVDKSGIDVETILEAAKSKFISEMDNDLNISGALAAIFSLVNELSTKVNKLNKKQATLVKEYILDFDNVLGIISVVYEKYNAQIETLLGSKNVIELIEKRQEFRENKEYKESDKIRDELEGLNVKVVDKPNNTYEIKVLNYI